MGNQGSHLYEIRYSLNLVLVFSDDGSVFCLDYNHSMMKQDSYHYLSESYPSVVSTVQIPGIFVSTELVVNYQVQRHFKAYSIPRRTQNH